jgi:tetratricopeptide (TPR) repeat protein
LLILISGNASAASIEGYLRNREGLRAFQSEDLEAAKKKFSQAQQADPAKVEPLFNEGVVALKQGSAEEAAKSFEAATRQAKLRGDAELSGSSLYNLGSAQEKAKQPGDAIRRFAEAIRMAQISGNRELELDARRRIEKLQQEKQKQDQQQKQDSSKDQSKDGKDQKDPKDQNGKEGSGQQQQPKDSNSKGDQEQKQKPSYEDPSVSRKRQGFKSDKLSQEDSERVMAELSAREKELQARLKKQRGARASSNGKDW